MWSSGNDEEYCWGTGVRRVVGALGPDEDFVRIRV